MFIVLNVLPMYPRTKTSKNFARIFAINQKTLVSGLTILPEFNIVASLLLCKYLDSRYDGSDSPVCFSPSPSQ